MAMSIDDPSAPEKTPNAHKRNIHHILRQNTPAPPQANFQSRLLCSGVEFSFPSAVC
ncbi:MAG TPA: hypothetical protein VFE47_07795 [Tepidisphaeraceae bacterium]|nr:hypothetical protein [Tepidisphaeraceae bacterium]